MSEPKPTEHYTHGHHPSVLRSHTWRTVANSALYLAPKLASGITVLDVGCGPGTITIDIAQRVSPADVLGIDASADVVAAAGASAAEQQVTNVRFVVGDAYSLDVADGAFDVVHAHQTLQHLADPVKALREMARAAREGGVVAARDADYGGMFWYPQLPELARWMDLYQAVHRNNGGEPDAGRHMRRWALEAGFSDVVVTASMWSFGTDTERAWWGGLWADRVLHSAFAAQALALGARQSELESIAEGWTRWASTSGAWFGVPHGEILATITGVQRE